MGKKKPAQGAGWDWRRGRDSNSRSSFRHSAVLFISADSVEGINRYGYVHGNPITHADPSGTCDWWDVACNAKKVVQTVTNPNNLQAAGSWINNNVLQNPVVNALTGGGDIINDISTFTDPHKSIWDKIGAGVNLAFNVAMDVSYFVPGLDIGTLALKGLGKVASRVVGEAVVHGVADIAGHVGEHLLGGVSHVVEGVSDRLFKGASHFMGDMADRAESIAGAVCGLHSFSGATLVATPAGSQPINTLKVGDQVTAYDSKTGKTQPEPVLHVFINHDTNLLDVTLQPMSQPIPSANHTADAKQHAANLAAHGSQAPPETIHTTTEHPFLTADRGFVDAADLHLGEPVVQLGGAQGVVLALTPVAGAGTYYNLTVAEEHTFAVGTDQWVVHNQSCGGLVEYGSTALSKVVQGVRRLTKDVGGNYASALLDDGEKIWARSGARHAEEYLLDKADAAGKKIIELYSERQPCAAKCAGLLQGRGITNVSWSWDWTGENATVSKLVRAAARKLW